ncbi:Chalcone isomerase [Sesbania bispinosa]|nr:Chalcone isomerase [Sesbania bispinosa]
MRRWQRRLGHSATVGCGGRDGLRRRARGLNDVASETVLVDEISYPSKITTTKPLSLLGHGITDMEIHFLQVKFYSIGVYLDPEVVGHLQQWKGQPAKELEGKDDFFDALIAGNCYQQERGVVAIRSGGARWHYTVARRQRSAVAYRYRSRRYALLAEDGIVKLFNLEEGGAFTFSSAEVILKVL